MLLRLLPNRSVLASLAVHAGVAGACYVLLPVRAPVSRPAVLLGMTASEVTGIVDAEAPPPVEVPLDAVELDPIPDLVPDAATPEVEAESLSPDETPVADSMPVFADVVPVGVRIARPRAAIAAPAAVTAATPPSHPVVTFAPSRRGARAESRPAERIGNAPPPYPAEALRRHWEGTAILDVRVTAEGLVSEATIYESSGSRVLDDASIAAALTYRYLPRLVDDVPAPDWLRVPFVWKLSGP